MDITIRHAAQDDVPVIADLHVRGWQGAYGGIIDQEYLDSLTQETREEQWAEWLLDNTTLIAYDGDTPAGFIAFGKVQTAPPGQSSVRPLYVSEIYGIYVLPEFYRHGIGRALMREAAALLKAEKKTSLCLWVLDKNERGKKFYEAMGGQRIGKHTIEIGPTKAKEICYGWRDTSALISAE